MPHYSVQVTLGTLLLEDVEAANADEAMDTACSEWASEADDIIGEGTFEVREHDSELYG